MKKLLITIMMLLPMMVMAYDFEVDGIYYNIISETEKTVEVTYKVRDMGSYSGSIAVPGTIINDEITYTVTTIGYSAFSFCSNLKGIILPNTIKKIDGRAFFSSSGITEITIPQSVDSIKNIAFEGCYGLSSVYIEDGDTPLDIEMIVHGEYAFGTCPLKSVYLGRNITFNSALAPFYRQIDLSNLIIGPKVTTIANGLFYGCKALETLVIPPNVTNILYKAFNECTNLKSVIFEDGDSELYIGTTAERTQFDGCYLDSIYLGRNVNVTNQVRYTFLRCYINSVKIGLNVTELPYQLFATCRINRVYLSRNIKKVWGYTFMDDPLTDVYCFSENALPFTVSDFNGCPIGSATLHVPVSAIELYRTTAPWDGFGTIVPLPQYKLIYEVDGEEYKKIEHEEYAQITVEPFPEKEGYTFSGWSEIPATMPAHDVIITGCFVINKYKLTFIVDGTEYLIEEIEYGSEISEIEAPAKEHYTFYGWTNLPKTMPAHDVTVHASYIGDIYNIIYIVDGQVYKKAEEEYGTTIIVEPVPSKEGYTFSGWSEIPETMPANDVTVTGTFSINSYTLTYMVDGTEYKTASVEYGSAITAETAPTKEGYTFSGWSEIPTTMPAHDVTVIGSFSINSYTITYVVDGAEYKTASVEYGSTIKAETEPTKEGYTFSGWSEIPATMPAHDVTVTGSFVVNKYKLIYMVEGKEYQTIEVGYGSEIYPIGGPEKEGYTFVGWENLPDETMPAHDVIVTGTFSINSYKVTFMYGDNVLTAIEVKYGEKIELPTSLNSERYTLIEWLNVPETMPAQDITIYADYVDGINDIAADSRDAQYIQMNGMYTTELKPGLNIIQMKDGTTKKVWVK